MEVPGTGSRMPNALEAFAERLEDGVTSELLTNAVVLGCGHAYNESTIIQLQRDPSKYKCPECREPIKDYKVSYTLRNLAETISLAPPAAEDKAPISQSAEPEKNDRNEESEAHFKRAKILYDQGLQEESVSALFKALELNPNYEKALDFLEFITDPKQNMKSASAVSSLPPKSSDRPLKINDTIEIARTAIEINDRRLFVTVADKIQDWSVEFPSREKRERYRQPMETLVHCAAASSDPFFLEFIVRKTTKLFSPAKIDWEKRGKNNFLPIHYATEAGATACLKLLLKRNPKLASAIASPGESPLHIAARNNRPTCIEALLDTDSHYMDEGSLTPLMISINQDYGDCRRILLERAKAINKSTVYLIMEKKLEGIFKQLLNRGLDVNLMGATGEEGYLPLQTAVRIGWKAGVKILANTPGILLNAESLWGRTTLDYAIEQSEYDIAEFLVEKGAISKYGHWVSWFRLRNARSYVARWLWGSEFNWK